MNKSLSCVSIIGAGTMGAKIAHRCAVYGIEAILYDKYPNALEGALGRIDGWLEERIKQGHLTRDQAREARTRIRPSSSMQESLRDADLVIETVPENLELKRQVLGAIDPLLPQNAFICTNSSSLPCSRMADVLSRPERFFNINFSQPQEPTDNLVELMRGEKTTDEALIVGEEFVRMLNMIPIITYREIMGFSFNRVWRAIKRETLHLVGDGYSDFEDLDRAWMMEFGTPFGPFGLMDIIGLDVIRDIEEQYYLNSKDERDRPPQFLEEMVKQGKLGVKSGQGFYAHPNPAYQEADWLHKKGKYREDIRAKLVAMRKHV